MANVKIGVEAELDSVSRDVEQLVARVRSATEDLRRGLEVTLDTGRAQRDIDALIAKLGELDAKIGQARAVGIDTAGAATQSTEARQAQGAYQAELDRAKRDMEAWQKSIGGGPMASWQANLSGAGGGAFDFRPAVQMAETLTGRVAAATTHTDRLRRAQREYREEVRGTAEEWAKLTGQSFTERQAEAANTWLGQHIASEGRFAPFMRGFDVGDVGSDEWRGQFGTPGAAKRIAQGIGAGGLGAAGMDAPDHKWASRMLGSAAGVAANAVLNGGDGGAAGLAGGVLGGMLGPAGAIVGAVVGGAVDRGMEKALAEALETSALRKNLGGLSEEFDPLRAVARAASDGLGMTATEFMGAERRFAGVAGTRPEEARNLVAETRGASQFARSLGTGPDSAIAFFANQRQFGVTRDEEGSRRMALVIAEALNKGGLFAKADELMQAVAEFTVQAARTGRTAPDVGGYVDLLGTLTARGGPYERDIQGAVSLFQRMDAGFRGPGSEGWNAFMVGSYQGIAGRGFNGLDLQVVKEGGLLGTLAGAWDSIKKGADPATIRHWKAMEAAAGPGANLPMIDVMLPRLLQRFGGNTEWAAQAIHDNTGIGVREAHDVITLAKQPGGVNGILERLKGFHVDTANVPMGNLLALAQLATGNREDLMKQARRLMSGDGYEAVAGTDRDRLEKAMGGSDADLRQTVIDLTANREMKDIAESSLDTQKRIAQSITSISSNLLKLKDAALAKMFGTPGTYAQAMKDWALAGDVADRDSVVDPVLTRMKERGDRIAFLRNALAHGEYPNGPHGTHVPPETLQGYKTELDRLLAEHQRDSALVKGAFERYTSKEQSYDRQEFIRRIQPAAERAAEKYHIPADVLMAHAAQETGWGKHVHDNNLFNITGSYHGQSVVRGDTDAAGNRISQRFKVYGSIDESFEDLADLLSRKYPGAVGVKSAYEYGAALKKGGYAADPGYAKHIDERAQEVRRITGTPLPPGKAQYGADGRISVDPMKIEVTHTHTDPSGAPIAPPQIQTYTAKPRLNPGRPPLSEIF
ncbi:Flagellum-specific peptidoglycan hydrolase FlgJ [Methylomagnum ishizawai]|uniref:Flagellum-specific peptidoglycan hydrolase FlgJ n=1 Tax=Methylomagnum ishizawai TaxID=1760988 RepID=A0A1Y6D1N3_9GAMM|nr:glucosaminidase domain-containing protein [Methylomagnum ishizawai]SMF93895.1 Flagellum-specific peptidoglycan hydrolase FlgJ [Methylomagnum ishizawai]